MSRAGKYLEAIDSSRPIGIPRADENYYGVRLANTRCLSLRYLGKLDEATECFGATIPRFEALGEHLELAAATLDFGTIELDRGNLDVAIELTSRAAGLAAQPGADADSDADDVRGRAEFYFAEALARSGQVAQSITHLQQAMEVFARSRNGRWEGGALLRFASILTELGATQDARAAIAEALTFFDETNAPGRIASSEMAIANVAFVEGDAKAALAAADRATAIYDRLSMPIERARATELRLRALLSVGDWKASRVLLDTMKPTTVDEPILRLARAELAIGEGAHAPAKQLLDAIDEAGLSLSLRVRSQTLRARLLASSGSIDTALTSLRSNIRQWTALGRGVRSPMLAERLERFGRELNAEAIDLLVAQRRAAASDNLAAWEREVERWLLPVPSAIDASPDGEARESRAAIDQAIAADVFPGMRILLPDKGSARRALLRSLAATSATAADDRDASDDGRPRLSELRRWLGDDDTLIALLEGQRHAILLRLSSAGAEFSVIEDRASLLRDVALLNQRAARRDSAMVEVLDAAAELGDTLLDKRSASASPGRLLILADSMLRDVAWPLLLHVDHGDSGSDRVVSLIVPTARRAAREALPGSIDVLVASQFQGNVLAPLMGAAAEAGSIARAQPPLPINEFAAATREQLMQRLGVAGGWVHVAAHGTLAPGRLGGTGIWLDPPPGESMPQYASWIEILERGVQARVVVLNACQLGQSVDAKAQLSSFAMTVLRAGGEQVVAAQWPISDAASDVWVSALYREASVGSRSLASATAAARDALRRSRAFRHTFYWGGLTHAIAARPGDALPD